MLKSTALAGAILVSVAAGTALAGTIAPDQIKIVDGVIAESLTSAPGDPVKGREWFAGRKLGNCLACHQNNDLKELPYHGEVGPPLDGVAERWDPAQLRAIVVNAKSVFTDETIMPAFYRTADLNRVADKFAGKTILTAQQVEDVIAYLMTLKEE